MPRFNSEIEIVRPEVSGFVWTLRVGVVTSDPQYNGTCRFEPAQTLNAQTMPFIPWAPNMNGMTLSLDISGRSAFDYLNRDDPYALDVLLIHPTLESFRIKVSLTVDSATLDRTGQLITLAVSNVSAVAEGSAVDTIRLRDMSDIAFRVALDDPNETEGISFTIWAEIEQDVGTVSLVVTDDASFSYSVTVLVRYDPRIIAGYLATLDGQTYRITQVSEVDRNRTMRLDLSR